MFPITLVCFENISVCYNAKSIIKMIEGNQIASVTGVYISYNSPKFLEEEDPVYWYREATQTIWVDIAKWEDTEIAYETIHNLREHSANIHFNFNQTLEATIGNWEDLFGSEIWGFARDEVTIDEKPLRRTDSQTISNTVDIEMGYPKKNIEELRKLYSPIVAPSDDEDEIWIYSHEESERKRRRLDRENFEVIM